MVMTPPIGPSSIVAEVQLVPLWLASTDTMVEEFSIAYILTLLAVVSLNAENATVFNLLEPSLYIPCIILPALRAALKLL